LNRRRHFAQKAVRASGLPEDIVLGMPRILVRGGSSLLLENHQGIIEYTPDRLRVRTLLGEATVEGNGLTLSELGENDLMLSGEIACITLKNGGAHGKSGLV